MIGRRETAVVGDVFSQRRLAVDALAVEAEARVLLNETLRLVGERVDRLLLPPHAQRAVLVVLPACGKHATRIRIIHRYYVRPGHKIQNSHYKRTRPHATYEKSFLLTAKIHVCVYFIQQINN